MLLINTMAHASDSASHSQIMFLQDSRAMQMSYNSIDWTHGIIILISLILSYIQNLITT